MDKQAHLSSRRSGEQKGRERGLAGVRTPQCQRGWMLAAPPGAAECTECAAPCAGLPTRLVFQPSAGHFLAPSEVTPEMSPQPPLCSPKARPHHPGFLCILCFICQLGTLGLCAMPQCQGWWAVSVECQPLCWPPGEDNSLPLASAAGQRWTLGWMDRV